MFRTQTLVREERSSGHKRTAHPVRNVAEGSTQSSRSIDSHVLTYTPLSRCSAAQRQPPPPTQGAPNPSIMWCSAASSTTCSTEVPDQSTFVGFLTTSCGRVHVPVRKYVGGRTRQNTSWQSSHQAASNCSNQIEALKVAKSLLPTGPPSHRTVSTSRVEWNCGERDFVHKRCTGQLLRNVAEPERDCSRHHRRWRGREEAP